MKYSSLAVLAIMIVGIACAGCAGRPPGHAETDLDIKAMPQPMASIVPVPNEPFPPGSEKDPLEPPRVLYLDVPNYPVVAKETRIEGRVLVELFITRDGVVDSARVVESTNHIFDRAAINAASRCRFQPGRIGDQPLQFRWMIPFEFSLTPPTEGPSGANAATYKQQPPGGATGPAAKLPPGSIREPR